MRVAVAKTFDHLPEILFAIITDIPHHVDWLEEPVELVSLSDGPAKLGTKWEQNAIRLGKKMVILNTCNIFELNRKFGWITEKPFQAQNTLLLDPDDGTTVLTWSIETVNGGIVQLVEPLLVKRTAVMIRKSLNKLEAFLQAQA